MATPSFSLLAEEDLTCPVCFEFLKDPNTPKLLDCPHVCCAVCIQKLIEDERKIVDCPECRHITRIPEDGVDAMKTNLRVRSLAEKHDKHMTKISQSCPQHHISIDYYCKKCNVAGCSTCMMKSHQGLNHDNVEIQVERKEQNTQMNIITKKVANNIEECKMSLNQLETLKTQAEENLSVQCKSIEKQGESAVLKVQQEFKAICDSLQKKERRRIECIDEERKRLLTQIQESQKTLTTVSSTIETSAPHDLVTKHSELERSLKILVGNKTGTEIDSNLVIGMPKDAYEKALTITRAIGRILQERKVQCNLVNEFGDFRQGAYITVTSSGLVVISEYDSKQVHTYSQQNNGQYKKQSSLSLSSKTTTNNPFGVAVMEDGKYLVARWTHVEVYSPSGKCEGALDVKYGDEMCARDRERGINNVKLMPDGRVLLEDYENSLLLILKEGITLRTIKTQIRATRVTIMSRGRIALSNCIESKVNVIDIESGDEFSTFDIPNATALYYHDSTDSLLVGRCLEWEDPKRGIPKPGSGVLEQYCATTGGIVGRIATGLYAPHDLTSTPTGELVLADQKTIKIFKIWEI